MKNVCNEVGVHLHPIWNNVCVTCDSEGHAIEMRDLEDKDHALLVCND